MRNYDLLHVFGSSSSETSKRILDFEELALPNTSFFLFFLTFLKFVLPLIVLTFPFPSSLSLFSLHLLFQLYLSPPPPNSSIFFPFFIILMFNTKSSVFLGRRRGSWASDIPHSQLLLFASTAWVFGFMFIPGLAFRSGCRHVKRTWTEEITWGFLYLEYY